jgi:hypothetical protein
MNIKRRSANSRLGGCERQKPAKIARRWSRSKDNFGEIVSFLGTGLEWLDWSDVAVGKIVTVGLGMALFWREIQLDRVEIERGRRGT